MTSTEGNHGRDDVLLHTSYPPSGGIVHPGFGSLVSQQLGEADFDLPHFVSIAGQSIGRASSAFAMLRSSSPTPTNRLTISRCRSAATASTAALS
jgi:hypothetical protein